MDLSNLVSKEDTLSELEYNFKILIVEDDDISYMLLNEVFSPYSVELIRACDGEEAIKEFELEKTCFDLVLMDIRLPNMNGYVATQKIKEINPTIPVIAVTACAHSQGIMNCYESGCDDFIAKPFDIKRITSKIESYLVPKN